MIGCMVKCRVTADASTGIDPVIGAKRRLVLLIYCLLLYSVIEIGIYQAIEKQTSLVLAIILVQIHDTEW